MGKEANHPPPPDGDPLGTSQPHDVLAAEEFAMPTPENRFPADPLGTSQPHDVLAAEEFGMPAGGATTDFEPSPRGGLGLGRLLVPLGLGLAVAVALRRRYG